MTEPFEPNVEVPQPVENTWEHRVVETNAPRVENAPKRAKRGIASIALVAMVSAVLGGIVGGLTTSQILNNNPQPGSSVSLTQAPSGSTERPVGSVAAIAANVTPSVVYIEYSNFSESGSGSGFIIDSTGYILTNNHVIEAVATTGTLTVDLSDGTSYPATIVGRNSAYDLAVIKIAATGLPAVTLGDSSSLVVGDTVIAIGAPLGLEGTVTSGIVSALNRPVTTSGSSDMSYISAVQTDAAINPGNSGGPLVNGSGQVVGVNSSIATLSGTSTSGSIGLGFAIPVNQAKRIAQEIIDTGESTIPIIGVQVQMVSQTKGATLVSIEAGGPAEKAGLSKGDVIVRVDGRIVRDATEFIVAVRAHAPGESVTLTLSDGSEVQLTLGSRTATS